MTVEYNIPRQTDFDESVLPDIKSFAKLSIEQLRTVEIIIFANTILGWKSPVGQRNMTSCRFILGSDYVDLIPIVARSSTINFWMKALNTGDSKLADRVRTYLCTPLHRKIINHIEKSFSESAKQIFSATMQEAWAPPKGVQGEKPGEYFMIQAGKSAIKAKKLGMEDFEITERIRKFLMDDELKRVEAEYLKLTPQQREEEREKREQWYIDNED
jgi:hypothetical protein